MLKISPIKNNQIVKKTAIKTNDKIAKVKKNNNVLLASMIALSIIGMSQINSCSKIEKEEIKKEQNDSTGKKDIIKIDDTLEEIYHEITLS